ncbi:MAG: hypothetical protein AAGG81_01700 [Chlamydiota bacterium]
MKTSDLSGSWFDKPNGPELVVYEELVAYERQQKKGDSPLFASQNLQMDSKGANLKNLKPPFSSIVGGQTIDIQKFHATMRCFCDPSDRSFAPPQQALADLFHLSIDSAKIVASSTTFRNYNLPHIRPVFKVGPLYDAHDKKDQATIDLCIDTGGYSGSERFRDLFESISSEHALDTQLVQKLARMNTPKNFKELKQLLEAVSGLLPADPDCSYTSGVIAARCAIEHLRKLPPPGDSFWRSIYHSNDIEDVALHTRVISTQLTNIMGVYGRASQRHDYGIGGLTSALLLTQVHLICGFFEILKNEPETVLEDRCLDLPELKIIRSLFLEMEGEGEHQLFHHLTDYLDKQTHGYDQQVGHDVANTPIFLLNPRDELQSTYELLKKRLDVELQAKKDDTFFADGFQEHYPNLHKLRCIRYNFAACLTHVRPEATTFQPPDKEYPREKCTPINSPEFKVEKGKIIIPGCDALLIYINSISTQNERKALAKVARKVERDVRQDEKKRIEAELYLGAMNSQEGAPLLHLERLLKHYSLDIEKVALEDVLQLSSILFSDSYLKSQLESSPELRRNLENLIKQLCDAFGNRGLIHHKLAAIHLLVKFRSLAEGKETVEGAYNIAKKEGMDTANEFVLPKDKAQGLALRLYTMMQLPRVNWKPRDRMTFCSDYLTFRFMTGQQEYPGLLGINPAVYYMYQTFYQPFMDALTDPNSETAEKLMQRFARSLYLESVPEEIFHQPPYTDPQMNRPFLKEHRKFERQGNTLILDHQIVDLNNSNRLLRKTKVSFDLEKMELLVNGNAPSRDQNDELKALKGTLKEKIGPSILSIKPDNLGGYEAKDRFGRTYNVTVNRVFDDRKGHHVLDSYNVTTQIDGGEHILVIDPECSPLEEYVSSSLHTGPTSVFAPRNEDQPLLLFSNGFPSLMIEKRGGVYDWRHVAPISHPEERLSKASKIKDLKIQALITQLGGPEKVIVWSQASGPDSLSVKRMEWKNLGLTLDVLQSSAGFPRFHVRGSGGFYIAEEQETGLREHLPGAILLRHEDGREKLLVTKIRSRERQNKGPRPYKPHLSPLTMGVLAHPTAILLLDISDVHGQRAIEPRSFSEALYLCEHFVDAEQYKVARYYLSKLSAVSEATQEDMKRIALMFAKLVDRNSPASRALALSLAAQELRFLHAFECKPFSETKGEITENSLKKLERLYFSYLSAKKPWPHLDVPEEDLVLLQTTLFAEKVRVPRQNKPRDLIPVSGTWCLKALSIESDVLSKEQLRPEDVYDFINSVSWATDKIFQSTLLWNLLLCIEQDPNLAKVVIDRLPLQRHHFQPDPNQAEKEDLDATYRGAIVLDLIYRAAKGLSSQSESGQKKLVQTFLSKAQEFDKQYEETIRRHRINEQKIVNDLKIKSVSEKDKLDEELKAARERARTPKEERWFGNLRTNPEEQIRNIQRQLRTVYQNLGQEITKTKEEYTKLIESERENREEKIMELFSPLGNFLKGISISYEGNTPTRETNKETKAKRLPRSVQTSSRKRLELSPQRAELLSKIEKEGLETLEALCSKLTQNPEELRKVATQAQRIAKKYQESADQLAKDILKTASLYPKGDVSHLRRQQLQKRKGVADLTQLINAWRYGDFEHYRELTYLDEVQIQQLDAMIYHYLMIKTRLEELQRGAHQIESNLSDMELRQEKELSSIALKQLQRAFQGPSYLLDFSLRNRAFLHFEGQNNLRVREKQLRFIDQFVMLYERGLISLEASTSKLNWVVNDTSSVEATVEDVRMFKELVAQLGTGSGKSKVLSPMILSILELMQSYGSGEKHLVGSVWPQNLYYTNVENIARTMEKGFGKKATIFYVSRNTNFTDMTTANTLLLEAKNAVSQGKVVNIHPLANRALYLNHLLSLDRISQLDHELKEIQKKLKSDKKENESEIWEKRQKEALEERELTMRSIEVIMQLEKIFSQANVTDDESHETHDPITGNLKFAYGTRLSLPYVEQQMIKKLTHTLVLDPELVQLLHVSQNQHKEILISHPELYVQKVAPKLGSQVLEILESEDERIASHEEEIFSYITGQASTVPSLLHKLPAVLQQQILLAKGLITEEIKNALQEAVNDNYGLSHEQEAPIQAIPYRAPDLPNEGSEYEKIYYTTVASAISMAVQGLNKVQTKEIATLLYQEALNKSRYLAVPINQTDTWKEVQLLFGSQITEKSLLIIANTGNLPTDDHLHPERGVRRAHYYFATKGIQQIQYYEKTLSSNPQTQRTLLGTIIHLSATPGAATMYAQEVLFTRDIESEEKVRGTLQLKIGNEDCKHVQAPDAQGYLTNICKEVAGSADTFMVVDAGAYLKGIQPKDVAQSILCSAHKAGRKIEGVEFFDGDEIKVITLDNPDPQPLALTTIPINRRICYCDKAHLFGADFVLPERANAIFTIAADMGSDTLFQAVGRERKLAEEQTLTLFLNDAMLGQLSVQPEEKTIDRILSHTDRVQRGERQQRNYAALQQQIEAIALGPMIHGLVSSQPEDQVEFFQQLRDIFIQNSLASLEELYGTAQPERDTLKCLLKEVKAARVVFEKGKSAQIYTKLEVERIERALQGMPDLIANLIKNGDLPEKIGAIQRQQAVEAQAEGVAAEEAQAQAEGAAVASQAIQRLEPAHVHDRISEEYPSAPGADIFCDAWLPGIQVDRSKEAEEKKVEAFGLYELSSEEFRIGRYNQIYQETVGRHAQDLKVYGDIRDQQFIDEARGKKLKGQVWMITRNVLSLGFYPAALYVMDLYNPKVVSRQTRKLQNPHAVDHSAGVKYKHENSHPNDIFLDVLPRKYSEMNWETYLACGKGAFSKCLSRLSKGQGPIRSIHTQARKTLGERYTQEVDAFFHRNPSDVVTQSHVSPNFWSERSNPINGAFNLAQAPIERFLVIEEVGPEGNTNLHTVLGSSDDLAYWEELMQKDRKRFISTKPNRSRHIEIWSVSNGVIERCGLGSKDGGISKQKSEIEEALRWERIKWKLMRGEFHLEEKDMKLFYSRFEQLTFQEQLAVIAFMEQLSIVGRGLHGSKEVNYPEDRFIMAYLQKVKQSIHDG